MSATRANGHGAVSREEGKRLLGASRGQRLGVYEQALIAQVVAVGLPRPIREYQGIPGRKFRFDLCWPPQQLAVEIDGAIWVNGRHSSGAGISRDCEKFSLAAIHGWRVLRVTTGMVKSGKALKFIKLAFA
jgi:very-short-patch-repair endonuclease